MTFLFDDDACEQSVLLFSNKKPLLGNSNIANSILHSITTSEQEDIENNAFRIEEMTNQG